MRIRLHGAGRAGERAARLLLLGATIVAVVAAVVSQAHAGVNPPPFVDLQKLVNGVDADVAPGVIVPVGSPVTFTYEVRLGSAFGDSVTVDPIVDDNGTPGTGDDFSPAFVGGDTFLNGRLDLGEIWLYSHAGTASLGLVTNEATVTVRDFFGSQATDSDPANYTGVATVPSPMPLLLLLSGFVPVAVAQARRARRTA